MGFFNGYKEYLERRDRSIDSFTAEILIKHWDNILVMINNQNYKEFLKSIIQTELDELGKKEQSSGRWLDIRTDWKQYYFKISNSHPLFPRLPEDVVISDVHQALESKILNKINRESIQIPSPKCEPKSSVEKTDWAKQDMILFPGKPIEDKDEFLAFIAGLIAYTAEDYHFINLKKLNSEKLFILFKATLDEYGYREQSTINKSLMKCYSPNAIGIVPARDINIFIDDLRLYIGRL